ncbi:MFS transporter [Amycolatopsis sp. NPDC021455]|uniref:MFS transporter n=1 Tax=Amycolatopsis sp. NPDC021455 TaxID=3154901 RepID=UPI0033DBAC40
MSAEADVRGTAAVPARPRRAPGWAVLTLLCLAQFMVLLDVSIVNVALPAIRDDLGFTRAGLQWVPNAYTLAYAGFLLFGGRLADLFGRRRAFIGGLVAFTAASLVCGIAPNAETMLAARAVQGLGGAVLSPAILTVLVTSFPAGPRRTRAMGAWSAVVGSGAAAGSLLGGLLTGLAGWRWIFYVNLPIGVLAIVAAWLMIGDLPRAGARRAADAFGAILVTLGLTALVYGTIAVADHGWSAPATLVPLALAVVLLAGFLLHEARGTRAPLLPLRLFRSRAVSAGNLAMFFLGLAVFPSFFFQSLFLQGVKEFSAVDTGLAFLPECLALALGAQLSTRLLARTGPRPLMLGGPAISVAGLAWMALAATGGSVLTGLIVPSVLATFGLGLAMTPVALSSTAVTDPADAGVASGLVNTTRQVGLGLGIAVLGTIAATRTAAAGTGPAALASGYALTFGVGAAFALAAVVAALAIPRKP